MSKLAARWSAALLLAVGAGMQLGCQACGSCHDYSSPVANCQCASCDNSGGGRAGSIYSGYYAQGDVLDHAIEVAQQPAELNYAGEPAPVRR